MARSRFPSGDEIAEPVKRLAERIRRWSSPPGTGTRPTTRRSRPRAARGRFTACRARTGPSFTRRWTQIDVDAVVDVGRGREDEGYSGFEKSDLARILRDHDVDEVYVCGLATDYCVRASAIDACSEGFEVTVVEDAVRGVEVNDGDSRARLRGHARAPGGPRVASSSRPRYSAGSPRPS